MDYFKELLAWKSKVFDPRLEKCKVKHIEPHLDDPEKAKALEANINQSYHSQIQNLIKIYEKH